ncbi:MAG: amino acid ABC transporter permease [Hyphomicrobiales bacterium]
MSATTGDQSRGAARTSLLNDPKVRSLVIQAVLLIALGWFGWEIIHNTLTNLRTRNIASGFGFLQATAGFSITQTLIPYSEASSYGRAILVGFLNTLLVAVLGIIFATILGFIVGVMRLSKNWLVAKVAETYIEVVRNVPLLLQIFVWYATVLKPLPPPAKAPQVGLPYPGPGFLILLILGGGALWLLSRLYQQTTNIIARVGGTLAVLMGLYGLASAIGSWGLTVIGFVPMGVFLSNRGFIVPKVTFTEGIWNEIIALVIGIVAAFLIARWARRRQEATGQQFPVVWSSIGLIVGLPLLTYFVAGAPVAIEYPELKGFNFRGGVNVVPEFIALLVAISIYTASFIAEIVRAGIQAVSHGQTEAAHALGLRPGPTLRLVVIPQAMRVIIPPLASQYLNLTKNSSLAVAVGYPDLVAMGGTVLNQTGQAVEIIGIWMAVYLSLSLATSLFMNWFNARVKLVER